jgi:putative spermidine/putrescine transport system permease protein
LSRSGHIWSNGFFAVVAVFLVLPMLVTGAVSITTSDFIAFPPEGFSLRWYRVLASNPAWRQSIANTLLIGSLCALLATIIGTMVAYGVSHIKSHLLRDALLITFLAPLAVPQMSIGMAMYPVFAELGIIGTRWGVATAQGVLALPFVVLSIIATIRQRDQALERAARTLGASPIKAFWFIALPLMLPGVAAGAILAFMTSFDDVIMPIFLGGFNANTLPKVMLDALYERSDPSVMAASTGFSLVGILMFLVLSVFIRRRNA